MSCNTEIAFPSKALLIVLFDTLKKTPLFPRLQLYEQELKGPPIESNASKLTLKCLQDPNSNKTDQKVNMYELFEIIGFEQNGHWRLISGGHISNRSLLLLSHQKEIVQNNTTHCEAHGCRNGSKTHYCLFFFAGSCDLITRNSLHH